MMVGCAIPYGAPDYEDRYNRHRGRRFVWGPKGPRRPFLSPPGAIPRGKQNQGSLPGVATETGYRARLAYYTVPVLTLLYPALFSLLTPRVTTRGNQNQGCPPGWRPKFATRPILRPKFATRPCCDQSLRPARFCDQNLRPDRFCDQDLRPVRFATKICD